MPSLVEGIMGRKGKGKKNLTISVFSILLVIFFLFLVCLAAVTVLHGGCSLPHSHLPLCPQPASPPIHREAQSQGHPLSPSLLPFTDKEITRTVSFPWAQEKELSLFLPAISPTYTSLLPPRTQPNGHFQHLSHKSLRPSRPFSST